MPRHCTADGIGNGLRLYGDAGFVFGSLAARHAAVSVGGVRRHSGHCIGLPGGDCFKPIGYARGLAARWQLGAVLWFGFVSLTAALNLVLDFERIDNLRRQPQPDYINWYVALGLMVTLVWLYISILRLIANLRR